MAELALRPLRLADETEFRRGHAQLFESDGFLLGLDDYHESNDWSEYVHWVAQHARGLDMAPGFVPATFLVAVVNGAIVGRTSIRHELNDFLAREGGHIGYGLLPDHRRRGYATEILRQSLIVARSLGIDRSLLICDDDNVGSIAVIEGCGGQLETTLHLDTGPIRHYWIPTP